MGAAGWIGRGDKNAADGAAVDLMRRMINTVTMQGVVVIGEGEKDEAPMLFNGERVGAGFGPEVDVAVDPLEGTRLTALGIPGSISVIAVAERGSMFFPGAALYMEKIAVGPEAAGAIDLNRSPTENVRAVAAAKKMRVSDLTVVVLERERHDALIAELRESGARVNLIRDGDVAPSIAACQPIDRRRHADGHRWHAGGRHLGRGDQVHGRRDPGPAVAAQRRRADSARSRAASTSTASSRPTISSPATTSSSRRPASRAAHCCAACAPARRGRDRVARDALPLGHGAADLGLPPERQARELRNGGLMPWDELYDDRARDRRERQGNPGRRRVDRDDQEALRRDRRRVDRGEPPRLSEPALHDRGHGGVHRRRDPLRRDDPPALRRRHAVRRAARGEGGRAGDQGRHWARSRSRSTRARPSPRGSTACASGSPSTTSSAPASPSGAP